MHSHRRGLLVKLLPPLCDLIPCVPHGDAEIGDLLRSVFLLVASALDAGTE